MGTSPQPEPEPIRPSVTIDDLTRWRDHGGTWRAVELTDEATVVELCTCYGEPVDMVRSEQPDVIAYVGAHKDDD
jgi:hypothetical protein